MSVNGISGSLGILRSLNEGETLKVTNDSTGSTFLEICAQSSNGKKLSIEQVHLFDEDCDGTIDSVSKRVNEYDEYGHLIKSMLDHENDGIIDVTHTCTYDDSRTFDRARDRWIMTSDWNGLFERNDIEVTEYKMMGQEVKQISILHDYNKDGNIDEAAYYNYDDNGKCVSTFVDRDVDGNIDEVLPGRQDLYWERRLTR